MQNVADVAGNHRLVALEQVAQVGEGKPHGFVLQADFEAGLSVGGLVEEDVRSHFVTTFVLPSIFCWSRFQERTFMPRPSFQQTPSVRLQAA